MNSLLLLLLLHSLEMTNARTIACTQLHALSVAIVIIPILMGIVDGYLEEVSLCDQQLDTTHLKTRF